MTHYPYRHVGSGKVKYGPLLVDVWWTERGVCQVRLAFEGCDLHGNGPSCFHVDSCNDLDPFGAIQALQDYFITRSPISDIPLDLKLTPFQKRVYGIVMSIPFGQVRSYRWVATCCGTHPRAVAWAISANPAPILVPCHRVIRSDSSLGGFSAGYEIKIFLLEHESTVSKDVDASFVRSAHTSNPSPPESPIEERSRHS